MILWEERLQIILLSVDKKVSNKSLFKKTET